MTEVEHLLVEVGLSVTASTARGRPTFTVVSQAGQAWPDLTYPDALARLTDDLDLVDADAVLDAALAAA